MELFLNAGGAMSFETTPRRVVLDIQGMGDNPFTLRVTDARGRTRQVQDQAVLYGRKLVGVFSESGDCQDRGHQRGRHRRFHGARARFVLEGMTGRWVRHQSVMADNRDTDTEHHDWFRRLSVALSSRPRSARKATRVA
jgi:hypothetical protein